MNSTYTTLANEWKCFRTLVQIRIVDTRYISAARYYIQLHESQVGFVNNCCSSLISMVRNRNHDAPHEEHSNQFKGQRFIRDLLPFWLPACRYKVNSSAVISYASRTRSNDENSARTIIENDYSIFLYSYCWWPGTRTCVGRHVKIFVESVDTDWLIVFTVSHPSHPKT